MGNNNITLKVKNVSKKYGNFTAVDDISFDVGAGRIFGFLGPNGAGKTSTIRMIVGINFPDSGSIELFGKPISEEIQDRIGYLPEERGLYRKMGVAEQLKYFASLKGIGRRESDSRIDTWLDRFGLSDRKDQKVGNLSKGMQQKIQFISTLLHDPEFIILDEPFSGLDPVNVESLLNVIADLKNDGKTIIFSTHLMETAERLCDDILLINKSKKVLGGTLREVKNSFARNVIALRAKGGDKMLKNSRLVLKIVPHADEKEIWLTETAKPQELLAELIASGAEVTKFEINEPSLKDIFIDRVKA